MLLGIDEIEQGKIPTTPTIASVIAGVQVQEAVKYLHKRDDLILLNGKGFIFNGSINDSYNIEYQRNEDCPSHYTFEDIHKIGKKFDEVKLNDITDYGKKHFGSNDFVIEFNNEIVYELADENNNPVKEFFGNLNLMSVKDVKAEDGSLLKFKSFHNFNASSETADKYSNVKIADMKIPHNDIITLRKDEREIHIEFESSEIFK